MRTISVPTHRPPTSAGEILREEFLVPLGISQTEFADRIGVTFHRLNEIIKGRRGVTIDTALRFAKALGTTPDVWLNLQRVSDMYEALHSANAEQISKIEPIKTDVAKQANRNARASRSRVI